MRPVRQGAVHSLWSRLFCGPLKMRRVPQEPVFGTEYLFRTVEACFLHRMPPKMRRVPQEAFLSTARMFRTIGGPLRYRMPDTEAGCRRSEAWRTKKRPTMTTICSLRSLIFLLPLILRSVPIWREVFGQHTPLAACLQHMHDVSGASLSVLRIKNIFGNLHRYVATFFNLF